MKYLYHKDNIPNPKKSQWDKDNRVWYAQRNKQLAIDRKVKTFRELELMYGLSIGRIQDLLKKFSNKFLGV